MEINELLFPWLDLVEHPAFCVKDRTVIAANSAAKHLLVSVGTSIMDIVKENFDAYENLQEGSLYLTIFVSSLPHSACVTKTTEYDIFVMTDDYEDDHLQAFSLASQHLRVPLINVMTVLENLLTKFKDSSSPIQKQIANVNQSIFQLQRIICNMSDADGYRKIQYQQMEKTNLAALFDEVMEKIQTHADAANVQLEYFGLPRSVFGMAYAEKLERAIYNLMSNAIKFSVKGKPVSAKLTQQDNTLCFTVCNYTDETVPTHSFWNRYRRSPAVEDSRCGIGLGMTMIALTATYHKGTILIDHPSSDQTRVTMTIAIMNSSSAGVRSPIMRIGDYAGGRDKALLELSEILPANTYKLDD